MGETPAFTGEQTGYGAGKKVWGRKRHIATNTPGKVMALGITAASVHDKPGALSLKKRGKIIQRSSRLWQRGAYRGVPPFTAYGPIEGQIMEKKATGGTFKVLPKRWIVQRTFAWLSNCRRLSKDYEKQCSCPKL